MKKILLIFIGILILGGVGFGAYKYVIAPRIEATRNVQPGAGVATLCDATKHVCSDFSKAPDGGTLKVILSASGSPVGGLEVDVGLKPGANQYYMKFSDNSGIALFEGIPAADYFIYFNGNSFPTKYGDAPTMQALVEKGGEKVIEIHLGR